MANESTSEAITYENNTGSNSNIVKAKYGKTHVKNYSILRISGKDVGSNFFFGKDYEVEFVEFESQD